MLCTCETSTRDAHERELMLNKSANENPLRVIPKEGIELCRVLLILSLFDSGYDFSYDS